VTVLQRDVRRELAITGAFDALDDRERRIVVARYLEPPVPFKELAVELAVSTTRIHQIQERAFAKLAKVAARSEEAY
jgi:RNA polymerase sigma-32 factor